MASMEAALSLTCGDCGAQLKSTQEAQDHAENTGHTNFAESTEPVLQMVCKACGKPCRSKTEMEVHEKRTGHTEFIDKTLESAMAIDTEAEAAAGSAAAGGSDSDVEMVVPEVDNGVLEELQAMGFSLARATRALHFGASADLESAVTWIVEHEDDADIDEMPLIPKSFQKPLLTPEEARKKAQELVERARLKKEEEEKRMEREREKARIRSGKELLEAKRLHDEAERKRILAQRKAEKDEEKRAREKIKAKLEEDKAERRRKLGLPPAESHANEGGGVAVAAASPAKEQEKQQQPYVPMRPALEADQMRDLLRSIKRNYKEQRGDEATKRCFQTLLTYIGNAGSHPDDPKYHRIRLGNAAFKDRVGSFPEAIAFLNVCGFLADEQQEFLVLAPEKFDKMLLSTAGSELTSAVNNPFFGVL